MKNAIMVLTLAVGVAWSPVVKAQVDSAEAAAAAGAAGALATSNWFVGVDVGYGRTILTTDLNVLDEGNCDCPNYSSGGGWHTRFGVVADYAMIELGNARVYLTGQLGYAINYGWFDQPGEFLPSLDEEGNVVYSEIYHRLNVDINQAEMSIGVGVKNSMFGLDVSFLMGYVTSALTENRLTITQPLSAVFDSTLFEPGTVEYADSGKTIITGRYETDQHTSLLYGLQVSVKYIATVYPVEVQIAPYYRTYFTSVHTFAETMMQVVGLDVRIGLR